jgi:hypothetical protein
MQRKQVATVEEVGTRLEGWRQSRRHKCTAIPNELWSAAIEVARRDGLGRTAAALRLDYGKLKRLMIAADGVEKKSASPSFMELIAPDAAGLAQCAIEMVSEPRKLAADLHAGAGARGSGLNSRPARPRWSASAGAWRSWCCDPDHLAAAHSGRG